jgi:hypothetical protein
MRIGGWGGVTAAAGLALAGAWSLSGLAGASRLPARASLVLDGVCTEPGYRLAAIDPVDLDAGLAAEPAYRWAELTELYATAADGALWVCVPLPEYSQTASSGEVGLAIDTTGDVPDSGGATDPNEAPVVFAYTQTRASLASVPAVFTNVIRPDVLVRGKITGDPLHEGEINNGATALWQWIAGGWHQVGTNWGGIQGSNPIGTNIDF